MRAFTSHAKRYLSLLLAVLIMVPAMSLPAFAADPDPAEGKLLSQVIVENYGDLSAAEKVILNSGVLTEDAAYPVIALPDDLITLDDENKVVWAKVVRTDGYIWMPDSVSIIVDAEEKEHIDTMTLNGDESGAFASYNYAGEKFTVEVGYKLFKDVEDAKELALLNVAYLLNQDITMAKTLTVKTEYATLGGLSMSVVDFLKTMTDETSGMALGLSGTIVDEIANLAANETLGAGMSAAAKQAAQDLQSQKGTGLLLAKLFATLGSKSYLELLANGSLESALANNYEDIAALAANDGLAAISDTLAGIIEEAEEARTEMYAAINDALDDVTYEGVSFDAVNDKAGIESAINKLDVEYQGILNTLNNQLEDLGYFEVEGSKKVESSADMAAGTHVSNWLNQQKSDMQAQIDAWEGLPGMSMIVNMAKAQLQKLTEAEAAAKAGLSQLETAREGLESALTVEENVETLYASKESVDMLVAAIQLLADKMAPAYNYEWNVNTDNKLIKSTDTATYKILTEAATRNDSYTKYTDSYVAGKELLLDTASSEYLMNVYSVTVNVVLQVINAANGTDEYVQTSTVALANDTGRDELAAQIDSLRADALSRQTAYIAAHYELAGTVGDMDAALDEGKLSDNVVYTYTYSPKEYTVSYGYAADDDSVPYGYTLTLPNYAGGESLVYDYTVNGTEYKQGAKVQIVGNTEVDRTTGKPYAAKDLYDALASLYSNDADVNAFLKAILTSGGVDLGIDNETMQVRVPEDSDNTDGALVSRSDRTVTALPFASNYEGKQWEAASVLVYGANDQLLETVTQWNGNQAEIDSAAFERIEVVYELDLDYSSAAVQTALNRVVKVYNDAVQQLDDMRALSDKVGYLEMLSLMDSLYDDMGPAAQEQVDFINANCKDAEGEMILANHVTAYIDAEYPLAYYYENAEEIIEQLQMLAGPDNEHSPVYILLQDSAISDIASQFASNLESIPNDFRTLAMGMLAADANIVDGEAVTAALQKLAGNTGFIVEVDNSGDEPKDIDVYPLQRALKEAGDALEIDAEQAVLALSSTLNLGGTENVKITVSIKFTGVTMDSSDDSVSVSVSKDIDVEEDIYAPILNSEVIELADLYAELVDGVQFTGGAGYEDLANALAALVGTQLTENVTFTYVWEEHCMHPVTSDATCMIGEICETCGEEVTDPDPEAHAWNSGVITTEATCEADGVVTYTCKHNGEHTKTTSDEARVAATGHSYTDYTFNNNATCEEDGTETAFCDNDCGSRHTRTKAGSALGHDFGGWVDNGDGHHIRYCGNANCSETEVEDHDWDWNSGVVTTNSTCTAEGVETFTCKHCDAETTKPIEKKPHNFTKWYAEAKGHVLTCADCGEWKDATLTSHSFSGSNCEIEYPCLEDCGYTKPRGEHLYGSNWTSKNEAEHYQTCQNSGCGKEVTEPHEFNKGVVTQKPTCTEVGVMTYTCTAPGCGASYTEDIPMVAHNYVGVVTDEASCTEDGEMTYTCSECGDFYTEVIPSADGHKYQTSLKTPATCTEPGIVTYTCSACGDSYDLPDAENYPATGHNHQGVVTDEPSCTEPGEMTYTCSKCGDSYTEVLDPTGHSHQGVVTDEPSCTEKGEMTYTCPDCGDSYTEEIDMIPHNYLAAGGEVNYVDCGDGFHVKACVVCGHQIDREAHDFGTTACDQGGECVCGAVKAAGQHEWVYTDAGDGTHTKACKHGDIAPETGLAHEWDQGTVTREPSCIEKGEMTYTCKFCGAFYTEDIDTVPHSYDNGVETIHPGCDSVGEMTYTCTVPNCGDSYTEEIPATGHSFTVYVPVEGEEVTCTEDGKEIASCDNGCGTTDIRDVAALGHNWVKDEQNSSAGHLVEVCANGCGETRTTLTGSVEKANNTTVTLAGNSHDNQYIYEYTINLGQYNGSGPEIVFTRQAENRDVTLDLVEAILNSEEYRDLFPANETLARMRITSFVTGVLTDANLDPENPDKIWQIGFIDKFANTLNSFVNSLNNRSGSAMSFALYNDGTEKVIVANISDLAGAQTALQGLVEYLMLPDNKYPVINMLGYTDAAASTFALRARAALSTEEYKSFLKGGTISLQALIDGILYEDGFGSETILNGITPNGTIGATAPVSGTPIVGTASAGAYLQTIYLQLGNSSAIEHNGLKMYLTLSDIDALAGYRGLLEQVSGVAEVVTENGDLKVNLTLPEKVLEAYLAAALATGLEEKEAIEAVEAAAAYEFIYGYLQVITEDDVTVDTLENTLSMLGQNIDLQQYESIFNMVQSLLTDAELHDQDKVISISRDGKATIDALLGAANVNLGSLTSLLNVITEYKSGNLEVDIVAHLNKDAEAPAKEFEVAVIDIQNGSSLDKADFAENGAARINAMQGTGAVMLLDDITGNLVFNYTTILDLNGKTITGSIKANAPLIIIDSTMDCDDCGGVDGAISGNVTIIAGSYTADVTAFLAEGYAQKNGTVSNVLYTIEVDNSGNVTYVINSDYIDEMDGYLPSVRELAVDIAADLVLNYITAAAFSVDGETVTAIDLTNVINLISGGDKLEKIVDELLSCVDVDNGVTYFINALFADLLNFEGIAYAIENDTAIATHTVTTMPWLVTVEHIDNGDYITASLTYNTDVSLKKEFDLSLVIDGQNVKTVALPLFKELAEIVDANETKVEVALDQPIYDDQIVSVGGTLSANVVADLTKGIEAGDYATVIGVILAYGNTAKRAAVADAINTGNMIALKEVFDNTSVKELFTALKAMSKDVSFSAMATKVGVTANIGITGNLEKVYRYVLAGTGKVLEKLEITGMDSKLGGLYDAQTGYYELSKAASRDGNYTHSSGYGVDYDLTLNTSGLKVKIFPETSGNWTVTVYGNKGDWDYGDNEIVITLEADEELTFEYWVAANRTLTSFKINGENVRSKYPANKTHTISAADFGSEVEIYIASTPTIVPSTKVICECGDPDCTCKTECHSVEYEDLAAILAENPNVWWHLDGHRYLDYVICKGLMIGTSTDPLLFEPGMLMSRSMIVTALYHLEGDPEVTGKATDFYTDVLDGQWYSDAIVWATNEGLVYGYGNDKFGANDVLTREQLATLFYRFTEYKGKDVDYNGSLDLSDSFTDAGDISIWALTGVEWAYDRGLISGPGNNMLMPKGDISRCEFAALLCHWIWGEYDD